MDINNRLLNIENQLERIEESIHHLTDLINRLQIGRLDEGDSVSNHSSFVGVRLQLVQQ